MKLYIASSWRNSFQQEAVRFMRLEGHEVYDFKNPRAGDHGFHWSEIDPQWKTWNAQQFVKALEHPIATHGFKSDFDAMQNADGCLLVLPCGRSAHIEAGYFVGANKPLVILTLDGEEPELMYNMASKVVTNLEDAAIFFHFWEDSCSTKS